MVRPSGDIVHRSARAGSMASVARLIRMSFACVSSDNASTAAVGLT